MTVSFTEIPFSILTPGVYAEIDKSRAVKGVTALPHEILIVGQRKTGSGTATDATVYAVASAAQARTLFGATSQLAQMIAAYKAVDPLTELFACSVADASGTNASGSFTWTGTATEAGELCFYIGGRRIPVAVTNGMTAAALETATLAALALNVDLPVTAAANAGTGVDLTAVHDGTIGNQIILGVSLRDGEQTPAGFTVTVTAMASGATEPTYSAAVTAMGDSSYATVVCGLVDATQTGSLVTEMESRFTAMRAIEGSLFACKYDTRANLTTLGNSFNSPMLVLVGAPKSGLLPLPWELAAQAAALDARQAQTDPARATGGQIIPGAAAAHRAARFTRAERDILLSDGISTVVSTRDHRLILERLVTTYQLDLQSLADTTLRDQQTLRLFSAVRYSARARMSQRFARFKLVEDDDVIPPGQPMTNPKGIKAELAALYNEWIGLGWCRDMTSFLAEVYVEIDASDVNRVNIILPPNFVRNLLVTAMKIAFAR